MTDRTIEETAEAEESDPIEESVEVGEEIGAALDQIDRHKQYARTGDVATVESISAAGDTIDGSAVDGTDLDGNLDEVPEKVAVTYRAPDGTRWRAEFSFPTSADAPFARLLDRVGVPRDFPSDIIGEEIPVVNTGSEWRIHVPPSFLKPVYRWKRWLLRRGAITYQRDGATDKATSTPKVVAAVGGLYVAMLLCLGAVWLTTDIPLYMLSVFVWWPFIFEPSFDYRLSDLRPAEQLDE